MRFEFIHVEKATFPVSVMCDVLEVSRSGYYAWVHRPRAKRDIDDEQLAVAITAIHQRSRGTYGSPRVHAELRADGHLASRKRVERLMRELGLQARTKRRYRVTTDSAHQSSTG